MRLQFSQIPYREVKREKIRLPKRRISEDKPAARRRMRLIKEIY